MSPIVLKPSAIRRCCVFGPAPHNRETGNGASHATAASGGTTVKPSGFAKSLATFATYFVPEMPTDAIRSALRP